MARGISPNFFRDYLAGRRELFFSIFRRVRDSQKSQIFENEENETE
jgi:hypothetical protein